MEMSNPANAGISCAVTVQNGQAVTSSLKVAEIFGKQHKNVLQSIQNIVADYSEISTGLNFQLSAYTDSTGRNLPMYLMNRDGFTLLAFSFTGKRAMQFKVAYINRFNEMEKELQEKNPKAGQISETSAIDRLTSAVNRLTNAVLVKSVKTPNYYEVLNFCKQNNLFKVNPQKFFRYYARQNWQENGCLIDWRSACFAWHNYYLSNAYR